MLDKQVGHALQAVNLDIGRVIEYPNLLGA
jgi:hypothetical protein